MGKAVKAVGGVFGLGKKKPKAAPSGPIITPLTADAKTLRKGGLRGQRVNQAVTQGMSTILGGSDKLGG